MPCCVHLLVADVALVVRNIAFLGHHAGSDGKHTHTQQFVICVCCGKKRHTAYFTVHHKHSF